MRDDFRQQQRQGPLNHWQCGAGTPLLLLHGLSSTGACWHAVARRLSGNFRVVVPDLLGFGRSDAPSADGYMEEQAQALGQLLDGLGIRCLVVGGHDFGGPVAMTLLRLRPDLRVRGVVLCNTNMFMDTPIPWPLQTAGVPLLGSLVYRLMAGSRFGLQMTYQVAVARKDTLSWREFSRDVDARNLRITQYLFQRSLANLPDNYRAVESQLRCTQAPVLVLWGDRDPFFSLEVGRRTAAAAQSGTFRELQGVGHFAPQEAPEAFADAVIDGLGRLGS